MPKLKPAKGKHFDGAVRQLSNGPGPTREQARTLRVREAMRALTGVELVYAVRCPDGLIKIGHTRNLLVRRAHINSALDAILAVEPGSYEDEQRLHDSLRASVARGREYYHPTADVLMYVNGIRIKLGVEPIT